MMIKIVMCWNDCSDGSWSPGPHHNAHDPGNHVQNDALRQAG